MQVDGGVEVLADKGVLALMVQEGPAERRVSLEIAVPLGGEHLFGAL